MLTLSNSKSLHTFLNGNIWSSLRAYRIKIFLIAIFSAAINLLYLVPAIYMLQVYDRVLSSSDPKTLMVLSAIALALYILLAVLDKLRSIFLIDMSNLLDKKLRKPLFDAAIRCQIKEKPYAKNNEKISHTLPNIAINDLINIRQFITGPGILAMVDAPWFPIYLGIIFIFHPLLGAVAFVGAAFLFTVAVWNNRRTNTLLRNAGQFSAKANQLIQEQLQQAEVMQTMNMQSCLRDRWEQQHHNFIQQHNLASQFNGTGSAINKSFRLCLQSSVLGVGALLVLENTITAGTMIAASILIGRMLTPIEQVINSWRQWATTHSALERVELFLNHDTSTLISSSPRTSWQKLTFQKVVVVPPGANHASLSNLTMEVKAGEILGVIGHSGAGKSSLARLIMGVWPSYQGSILCDEHAVNNLQHYLHIGYLPQNIELFSGTVAENIARFNSDTNEDSLGLEKIVKAAKLANVHDMIKSLPDGYHTLLGEQGSGLSGGQKQGIAFARALFDNPSLLVLDEPNSQLDQEGETALKQTLQKLRQQGTSVILITHRAAILNITDKLLVLKAGKPVMLGDSAQIRKLIAENQKTTRVTPFTLSNRTSFNTIHYS
ncbi:MAG: type I secretion system permease/ATPase [Pseudomonadota bacterium]